MVYFTQKRPLLQQLARHGLEFDQKLARAFEVVLPPSTVATPPLSRSNQTA